MAPITWHEIPFLRICIPFIAGILIQQHLTSKMVTIACAIAAIVLYLVTRLLAHRPKASRTLRSLAFILICITMGCAIRAEVQPSPLEIANAVVSEGNISKGVVMNTENTAYGCKVVLQILSANAFHPRAIAYLRIPKAQFNPGDTLIWNAVVERIPTPQSPFAFDIARYYHNQGICLRTFIDSTHLIDTRIASGFRLKYICARARDHVSRVYASHVHNPRSLAVLKAMTIGQDEEIDQDLSDAYARSGAIHVLSISGLHVGIVSVLLYLLIGRTRAKDSVGRKAFKVTVLLAGIWSFASIAGMSPSIMRAALMFSIYLIGMVIQRPVRGMNVLACSACICLCIDPFQINSLSFQFSYLALCGILVFFKPIYGLVSVRTSVTKYVWGTIALSVSAQVLLIPLMITHFHQISIISAISSLVVIPASYIILLSGAVILILDPVFNLLADLLGQGIDLGIDITNRTVIWMSELPFSYVSGLYLTSLEIGLLIVLVVSLALATLTRIQHFRRIILTTVTLFGIAHVSLALRIPDQQVLAVFPTKDEITIDVIRDNVCQTNVVMDSMSRFLRDEINKFRYAVGVRICTPFNDSLFMQNTSVLRISLPSHSTDTCTVSIITQFDPDKGDFFDDDWIVAAVKMTYADRNALREYCATYQKQFHDLREDGALYLIKQENRKTYDKIQKRRHLES